MLETLVTTIHIIVAVFMILVVLLQGGNQGGIGAAFGGGNSQGVFGAGGATSFLGKLTYGAAVIFMLTSITLTIQQGGQGDIGLKERLEEGVNEVPASEKPNAEQPAPAGETEEKTDQE